MWLTIAGALCAAVADDPHARVMRLTWKAHQGRLAAAWQHYRELPLRGGGPSRTCRTAPASGPPRWRG